MNMRQEMECFECAATGDLVGVLPLGTFLCQPCIDAKYTCDDCGLPITDSHCPQYDNMVMTEFDEHEDAPPTCAGCNLPSIGVLWLRVEWRPSARHPDVVIWDWVTRPMCRRCARLVMTFEEIPDPWPAHYASDVDDVIGYIVSRASMIPPGAAMAALARQTMARQMMAG
jgi:hypothetical protein